MQGADHGTVTDNWTRNWQASIAVKITAIVIWAIILIAFVLSIFLLKDLDREIQADYELKADQIAYQIAMLWADANSLSDEQLGLELRARFEGLGFTGLVLSAGEERMQVGRIQGYPDSVSGASPCHGKMPCPWMCAPTIPTLMPWPGDNAITSPSDCSPCCWCSVSSLPGPRVSSCTVPCRHS